MASVQDDVKDLRARIQQISSTKTLLAQSALKVMLDIVTQASPVKSLKVLHDYLEKIISTELVVEITASELSITRIVEVFGLSEDALSSEGNWTLHPESIIEVPGILRRNLKDLEEAFYDDQSEATRRIGIDIILIQCRKFLRRKYATEDNSPIKSTLPATPVKSSQTSPVVSVDTPPKKPVRLFTEASISTEMENPSIQGGKYLITGRADWALGYGTKHDEGALLVAIEAKKRSEFSSGETQLLAYLAILRENRRRAGKTNSVIQGFHSDGRRFGFTCLKEDGNVLNSPTFDIHAPDGLKMIYSFIIAMLDTAMKSTPTASPTKPGEQQKKEVQHYNEEVWSKIYKHMDNSLIVLDDSDEGMEDAFS
ncbi:MAG: hypothetical protein Q9179_003335 [Wetmoreana sp. 5 TL-2023]